MKQRKVRVMAETKVSKKSNIDIQETNVKTKPKKTKKVEPEKIEKIDDVKVDVEIDLRSYNHSDVVGGYIRRKRSI